MKAKQTWLELWRELISEHKEFYIPLRLLNAGVPYKEMRSACFAGTADRRTRVVKTSAEYIGKRLNSPDDDISHPHRLSSWLKQSLLQRFSSQTRDRIC